MEKGIFYYGLCFLQYIKSFLDVNGSASLLQPASRKANQGKENTTFIQEHFLEVARTISIYVLLAKTYLGCKGQSLFPVAKSPLKNEGSITAEERVNG